MKIGELARRSGMAASRIRFYESMGLIEPVRRRAGGHRDYPAEALARLERILGAQRAGCSLEEIGVLLTSSEEVDSRVSLRRALKRKIAGIEALESKLAAEKAQLMASLEGLRAV